MTKRHAGQSERTIRIVEGPSMMQAMAKAWRSQGATIGFVPTMGALHEGHLALMREARLRADVVVASIFVNPLQFNDPRDLAKYPRTVTSDVNACMDVGVDAIFAPAPRDMYPAGYETTVKAGPLGVPLEGASRPGHFDGMLTVVLKLFHIVEPHFAVFGEKDFQQLQLVRRMVSDFHLPIEIVPMPVIRDTDGLALSSRNARLSPTDRRHATALSRALLAAQDAAAEGERRAKKVEAAARAVLSSTPRCAVDYVACVHPKTLAPVSTVEHGSRLLIAARIGVGKGATRLIDNGPLFVGIGTPRKPKALVAEAPGAKAKRSSSKGAKTAMTARAAKEATQRVAKARPSSKKAGAAKK